MEEKLRRLMKHEGINSTRLAEILGIQASGISHIMSGRNKPSFDFLLKLLQRFPQISPDWLLLDKGPMYRDEIKNRSSATTGSTFSPNKPAPSAGNGPSFDLGAPIVDRQGNSPRSAPEMTGLFSDYQVHNEVSQPDNNDIIPAESLGAGASRNKPHFIAPEARNGILTSPAGPSITQLAVERIVLFFSDKTFVEYHPEPTG